MGYYKKGQHMEGAAPKNNDVKGTEAVRTFSNGVVIKSPKSNEKKPTKKQFFIDNLEEAKKLLEQYFKDKVHSGSEDARNREPRPKTIDSLLTIAWEIRSGKNERWNGMTMDMRRRNQTQHDDDVKWAKSYEDEIPELCKDDIPHGYKDKSHVTIAYEFFTSDLHKAEGRRRLTDNPYLEHEGVCFIMTIKIHDTMYVPMRYGTSGVDYDNGTRVIKCTVQNQGFSEVAKMLDKTFGVGNYNIESMNKEEEIYSCVLNQNMFNVNKNHDEAQIHLVEHDIEINKLNQKVIEAKENGDMYLKHEIAERVRLEKQLRDEHKRISGLIEEIMNDTKSIYELRKEVDRMAMDDEPIEWKLDPDATLDLAAMAELELTDVNLDKFHVELKS